MRYEDLEEILIKHNSNFYYFLKTHLKVEKDKVIALIDTKPFSSEFLETILDCMKEYKQGIDVLSRKMSLINSIEINDLYKTIKVELGFTDFWKSVTKKAG